MEKYITDKRTGLRYELIGDIYYLAGDDQPEKRNLSRKRNPNQSASGGSVIWST